MRHRLLILTLFCAANLAAAQRTFVSAANGSDANTCTRALPCRSFAAALPFTDADGELIVVDSGGYGPVAIAQPVSLISPSGVYAGITAVSGDAISVNAGDTAHVILRNLSLNSQGATNGIRTDTAASLSVEGCNVGGFQQDGISFDPTTSNARLDVTECVITKSGFAAIYVGVHGTQATGTRAVIDGVHLYENKNGIYVDGAQATIRNSVASGISGGQRVFLVGFVANAASTVVVENSAAIDKQQGFVAAGAGSLFMTRCVSASNSTGIYSTDLGSTVYVTRSTIDANALGIDTAFGGAVRSRGDNTLQANTINGSFTSFFGPQ